MKIDECVVMEGRRWIQGLVRRRRVSTGQAKQRGALKSTYIGNVQVSCRDERL